MKNPVFALIAAIMLLSFSCATGGGGGGSGLSLFEAIEQSAEMLAGDLPPGSRVAIVAFESESDTLSDFIMEEFTAALVALRIEVADRQNLGAVFMEMDFHMQGYVSDETAMSIGQFLGAELVITGQLWDLGPVRRFAANAVHVETATRSSARRLEVRNDRDFRQMVAALDRQTTAQRSAAFGASERVAPRSAGTYLDRGIMLATRGDFDAAIADFTQAIRLNPASAEAFFWRANAHRGVTVDQSFTVDLNFDRGRLDLAIADFSEAIRLNPAFARAYTRRGSMHLDRGDFDRAIADHTRAIQLNPHDARSFTNRGGVHFNRGDFDRAIADHTEALRINPQLAVAHFNRGLTHERRGNLDLAIADFEAALRINPDSASSRQGLERVRQRAGQ